MIYVGIDMGVESAKAVVVRDNQVIGHAKASSGGWDRPGQAEKVCRSALSMAGVRLEEADGVTATGKGKYDVPLAARRVTETIAAVHAAKFLCADATGVLSVGADECIAATMGKKRLVGEFVLNQKCSAGLGTLLQTMSRRLGMTLEELSAVNTEQAPDINQGCAVFAELDALSLLNRGEAPETVAGACIKAAAVRAASVLRDLTLPQNERVVLIGGMAKNRAFAMELEKNLRLKLLVPEEAEFAGAIGAAISAEHRTV